MFIIPDIITFRDFGKPVNDDIINCFETENSNDNIKDDITKEEKTKLETMMFDKYTITNNADKEAKTVKIKEFVTGLKIKYTCKKKK
jgi:hypothetical protein